MATKAPKATSVDTESVNVDQDGVVVEPEAETETVPEMTEYQYIVALLEEELETDRVKLHPFSKMKYLEGYDVINTANRIFGHLSWSMITEKITPTEHGYIALVTVEVTQIGYPTIKRSGTGYGAVAIAKSGANMGNRTPDAEDTAVKAAETDAMKRAFRTFGNQFGNSLYEKTKPGGGGGGFAKPAQNNFAGRGGGSGYSSGG